jgi:integrase
MAFLARAKARSGDLGYLLNDHGARIGDLKRAFAAAAVRAGFSRLVQVKREGETIEIKRAAISPHVLRHTAGTWMAQRGVPLWEIAGYLGHSYERTSELYAHHHPDYLQTARKAFE